MQQTQPPVEHVAIICDGNRRWARSQGWEVFKGHEQAVKHVFEPLIEHAQKVGIKFLTFWIFSTENWQRDAKEVGFLMNLFRDFFDTQIKKLDKNNVRFNMIGNITRFDADIQKRILQAVEKTKDNTAVTVTLAMNYGGRDELVRGVQRLAEQVTQGKLKPEAITADTLGQALDTAGVHLPHAAQLPDPDIIIRTSGEQRLSGFMSWQQAYSEFFFVDFHFPDFSPEKMDQVLAEFYQRSRRFGK